MPSSRPGSRKPVFPDELTELIDVSCHLVDARMPDSTLHLEKRLLGKELIVLNKADLVEPEARRAWAEFFRGCGYPCFAVSSTEGNGFAEVLEHLQERLEHKRTERRKLGITKAVLRLAVVGMPNVGKSSFINELVREKTTRTGDAPGVTKGHQWISVIEDVQLLDTPGVVRRKASDRRERARRIILNLAQMDPELEDYVEEELYRILCEYVPQQTRVRYGVDEFPEHAADFFMAVARQRDYRQQGGGLNWRKALSAVMRDLRRGELGKFILERPPGDPREMSDPLFTDRSRSDHPGDGQ